MTKRELKELIKEALVEVLPEALKLMNEAASPGRKIVAAKPQVIERAGELHQEMMVIDGEKIASGQGVLEWFKRSGGKSPASTPEHSATPQDIESYVNKLCGRK